MSQVSNRYPDILCRVIGCRNKALRLIIDAPESICRVCADHYYVKQAAMEYPHICWTHDSKGFDLDLIQLNTTDVIIHLTCFLCYHLILYHDHMSVSKYNTTIARHLALPPRPISIELQKKAVEKIKAANPYAIKYFGASIETIYDHIKASYRGVLPWGKFGKTWFIVFEQLYTLSHDQSMYGILRDLFDGLNYKKITIKKMVDM